MWAWYPILGSIIEIGVTAICVSACAPFLPLVAAITAGAVEGITTGRLDLALKAGLIAGATAWAFNAVGDLTYHNPNPFTQADPDSGFVKDSHGVSVFDNPTSTSKGWDPHEVNQSSIPDSLRIIQRGGDPHHYEIVPRPGANLTPGQFINACTSIMCK
jgi:hypothetical protein